MTLTTSTDTKKLRGRPRTVCRVCQKQFKPRALKIHHAQVHSQTFTAKHVRKYSDIRYLSLDQLRVLKQLLDNPKHYQMFSGSEAGGAVRSLFRAGWIVPFGVIDKRQRWLLKRQFSNDEVTEINDIVASLEQ